VADDRGLGVERARVYAADDGAPEQLDPGFYERNERV
jgi:hypothetical protein